VGARRCGLAAAESVAAASGAASLRDRGVAFFAGGALPIL
jgi:hypothetical protein